VRGTLRHPGVSKNRGRIYGPVFDAVAESAARLCVSRDAQVFVCDRGLLHQVSHHGSIPISPTRPLISGTANGRAVLEGRLLVLIPATSSRYVTLSNRRSFG